MFKIISKISFVGGSDGQTAIFMSTSPEAVVLAIALFAVVTVAIVGAVIYLVKKKK